MRLKPEQVGSGCRQAGRQAGSYLRLIDSCVTQLKADMPHQHAAASVDRRDTRS